MDIIRREGIISIEDINDEFVSNIMNTILQGACDVNSVPKDGIYNCIQPERLGNKNNLPKAQFAVKGEIVSAVNLYNNLVALTTVLTRVGTYSYVRTFKYQDQIVEEYRTSGKALFNDSYIRQLKEVRNESMKPQSILSANSIKDLFTELLNSWRDTSKHHNEITNELCHSNCHVDCHSDCHSDSVCYK